MTELAKKWLKRYYSIPADKCEKKDALNHSLRKWEGLAVIKEYGVIKVNTWSGLYDADGIVLIIDAESCALCVHYVNEECECEKCPLYAVRGVPCDVHLISEMYSPYTAWVKISDPFPMINLLKKAKQLLEKEKQ